MFCIEITIVNVACMHKHVYGYFVGKVSVPYYSEIYSEKTHISVTLDLVADKLRQSVCNPYYRLIFTGALMVLPCLDLAIVSLLFPLSQVFSSDQILQLFTSCAFLISGL